MPPPVRRSVFVLSVTLALVLTGTALAGNGGLAPVSPASPDAKNISDIYWLILGDHGRDLRARDRHAARLRRQYRSKGRARELEGPQVRGHTNLELAWTAGPA